MARRRRGGGHGLTRGAIRSLTRSREGRVLLVLLLIAVVFYAAYQEYQKRRQPASPTVAAGPSIRIATWNLKKFSEVARPDIVMIAKIIQENGFHLVAIQEVQREGQAVERLRRQLNEPWRHWVSPRTGNNERYAFLYRADMIEPLGEAQLTSRSEAPAFDRAPCVGSFKAGAFDFTLMTVHLSYTDRDRRAREAESLSQLASGLAQRGPERDIIVLGDFNEQGKGNLHYFDSIGWQRLNAEPTNLGATQYIFDNILIDPRPTREYAGRTGVIRFDETHYTNDDQMASDMISDHRPVYADFVTTLTDDD